MLPAQSHWSRASGATGTLPSHWVGQEARLLKAGTSQQTLPAGEGAPEREVALVLKAPGLLRQAPEQRRRDVQALVEAQEAAWRYNFRYVRQRACGASCGRSVSMQFLSSTGILSQRHHQP